MDRRLPLSFYNNQNEKNHKNNENQLYCTYTTYIIPFSIYDNKCTFILFFIQTVFLITIRPFIIKKFRKDSKEELKYEQNL